MIDLCNRPNVPGPTSGRSDERVSAHVQELATVKPTRNPKNVTMRRLTSFIWVLAAIALVLFLCIVISKTVNHSEGSRYFKHGNKDEGVASRALASNDRVAYHSRSKRQQSQEKEVSTAIDALIQEYGHLNSAYGGQQLSKEQMAFIMLHAPDFSGDGAVDFYIRVVSMSSDSVAQFAANVMGSRLFAGGVESGLRAMAGVEPTPTMNLLCLHAGGNLGQIGAQDLDLVCRSEDIDPKLKESLIKSSIKAIFARGPFDSAKLNVLFNLLSENILKPDDVAGSMWLAGPDTEFKSLIEKSEVCGNVVVRNSAISAWGKNDPMACAEYLVSQADPAFTRDRIQSFVNGWCETSPQDAAKWVININDVESKNLGIEAVSVKLAELSPDESISWAASISDESRRIYTLKKIKEVITRNQGESRAQTLFLSNLQPQDMNLLNSTK